MLESSVISGGLADCDMDMRSMGCDRGYGIRTAM